uniref:THAP4-like heme-binding domain-containing protein n=2 Tax=Onchocerca TaxID=6281 RepID=A0A8R1TJJ2_ONCVO
MKILLLAVLSLLCIVEEAYAGYEERYDLRKLPPDLKPIMELIGIWQLETKSGPTRVYGPPDLIDIAIHPIPKFGARAANITHTYFDSEKNIIRSDYGFMPVKNATKRDPRIHIAYLTTSSEGYSMMEQGTVIGRKITFHLKQFLRRTFSVRSNGIELDIREFERRLEILDFNHMIMKVRAETAGGTESFSATYRKIMP